MVRQKGAEKDEGRISKRKACGNKSVGGIVILGGV